MTKICICGGGSLGHVCAGVLSSMPDVQVNIHTRRPEAWSDTLIVTDCEGKKFVGHPSVVSADEKEATNGCDIIFLCLPGFAIEDELRRIKPCIGPDTVVGSIVSSTGFFFAAHDILDSGTKLFGFQRVPFIARMTEYVRSANLLGYKAQLAVAVENIQDKDAFCALVEKLWLTPTKILGNYYEAALSNSNPILHPARLYSMWKNWDGELYDHCTLFYSEWNDDASLTAKIRSIPAFKSIHAPMKSRFKEVDSRFYQQIFYRRLPVRVGNHQQSHRRRIRMDSESV